MRKQTQINILSQLHNEYKLEIGENKEASSRDTIATKFKTNFLNKFDDLEPTDLIKLCYEYFLNIISNSSEKNVFFDYNLLMFEIIASKLVRKTRVLDVWFPPNIENKKKLLKLFNQAQKEICFFMIPMKSQKFISDLENVLKNNSLNMKILVEELPNTNKFNQYNNVEYKYMKGNNKNSTDQYIIVDKRILILGFIEWDENKKEEANKSVILIENESLARAFCQNFEKLWNGIKSAEKTIVFSSLKESNDYINRTQITHLQNNQNDSMNNSDSKFLNINNIDHQNNNKKKINNNFERKKYKLNRIPLKKLKKIARKMKKIKRKSKKDLKITKKIDKMGINRRKNNGFLSSLFGKVKNFMNL